MSIISATNDAVAILLHACIVVKLDSRYYFCYA